MQDRDYSDDRPALQREQDRIASVLVIAGVEIIGTDISLSDGMADVAWRSEDGTAWLAVISTAENAARDAKDGGAS